MTDREYVEEKEQMLRGKTIEKIELRGEGAYERWLFTDGTFWEFHTSLNHVCAHEVPELVRG